MDEEEEKKKEIDVVSGDGSEIEISPVYDHIILDKPNKNEKKENIVIPKEHKIIIEKNDDNTDKDSDNESDNNQN